CDWDLSRSCDRRAGESRRSHDPKFLSQPTACIMANPRFTSVRVVPLRIRTKIRADAPPAQRIEDLRAGAFISNSPPPALGNATVLGTSAAYSNVMQGLLSLRVTEHGSPFK
ncbi:unnamed protein product, partial [Staurois parvus]